MADNVNRPAHYAVGRYECIDVMTEIFGVETVKSFCVANAFKYIWRMNRKNGVEDAEKSSVVSEQIYQVRERGWSECLNIRYVA